MLGEFHSGPPAKGGLWNPDFRPLHSPVPLLAVRHMVATDLPFLIDDAAALRSYLERFGSTAPPALRQRAACRGDPFRPHPGGDRMSDLETGASAEKRARLARLLSTRAARPRRYPLSYGQQRLWFLDRFQPGTAVYNIPAAYRVRRSARCGGVAGGAGTARLPARGAAHHLRRGRRRTGAGGPPRASRRS